MRSTLLQVLPTLLSEGLSETRTAGKTIATCLMREARQHPAELERVERLLRRHLNDSAYRKLREAIDNADQGMVAGGHQVMSTQARQLPDGRRTCAKGNSTASSASGGSSSAAGPGISGDLGLLGGTDEPLDRLATICTALEAHDWIVRKDAVSSLIDLVGSHGQLFVARSRVISIFDALIPRLNDSNSKVNVVALRSLEQLIPKVREGMGSVTGTLVPALAASLASSNAQVRSITPTIIDTLMAEVDHAAIIQPVASCVLYSPPKARPVMIDRLSEISRLLYPTKPQLVIKHTVPATFRLVEDLRTELRPNLILLLRSLRALLGEEFVQHLQRASSTVQARINEMLQ